jgi:hypothetical protein
MVAHVCNPSPQVEAGGLQVRSGSGLHSKNLSQKKKETKQKSPLRSYA